MGRNENFDGNRQFQDTVSDEIILNASYLEVENLALRYTLRWSKANDRLAGVQTTDLNQGAQVSWSGSFFERRLATSVNYTVGYRTGTVESSGSGTVSIQQFPVGGLSLVETFPSIPSVSTLAAEPGPHRRGRARERRHRHRLRPVARRRPEPPRHGRGVRERHDRGEHAPALGGPAAARPPSPAGTSSRPGRATTTSPGRELPVGAVTFGVFENRFDIPIARTRARYLKVVTRPLTTAVTTDPQFNAVLVTELQPFLVVPASEAPRTSQQWGGNFNGSARLLILQDWNLAYTLAFNTSHEGLAQLPGLERPQLALRPGSRLRPAYP